MADFLEQHFKQVWEKDNLFRAKMKEYYYNRRAKKPPMYDFYEGQLVMLRTFEKKRLQTNAVGPFVVVKLFARSAIIRPLIRIQGEYKEA